MEVNYVLFHLQVDMGVIITKEKSLKYIPLVNVAVAVLFEL